jgi:Predicted transcriptional regulators
MGLTTENSNAIALGLIGDEWNLAIVRLAIMSGVRRYKDFRDQLGIANSVLTARLRRLTEAGVFTMAQYSTRRAGTSTCSPSAAATCGRCC